MLPRASRSSAVIRRRYNQYWDRSWRGTHGCAPGAPPPTDSVSRSRRIRSPRWARSAVVVSAAVSSLADGEPFAIDVESRHHRSGPSNCSAVLGGNGVVIVAAMAGASVHDSKYPRTGTAQTAPVPQVDRTAADPCALVRRVAVCLGAAKDLEEVSASPCWIRRP